MKILTASQIRQLEERCAGIGLPSDKLMENAGKAVAGEVERILGGTDRRHILFLVGPGNNGGDGLVAARHLHDWGARVTVYLLGRRGDDDPNLKLVRERDIGCVEAAKDEGLSQFNEALASADAVIDALFGTGTARPFSGNILSILDRVNKAKKKRPRRRIIALDLPSGINADSGAVDPATLYADYTITLGCPKPGLFNFPGAERVGKITVADIGMPENMAEEATSEYLTGEWVRPVLPERPLQANKGSFGRVLVVAGSMKYIGAAYLACSGAIRVGAGLVTLAATPTLQSILASKLTEVTYLPLPESRPGAVSPEAVRLISQQFESYNVLLLGCGLGQSQAVVKLVRSILIPRQRRELPVLVLDADALNTLADTPRWWQQLTTDAILTPHSGEMARLTGMAVAEIQADRLEVAKKWAAEWNKTVVLKGAYTVIASPEGRSVISPVANPGLASAGSGDVLTGAIAGLAAQGLPLFEAAAVGVYLHGEAGELVRNRLGDAGMIASDLLPELPVVIKNLKEI
ncbi:MAG: NAD(P)H-hydrate dehydratase [Deltaproteobacteria bacterium]|nr:NAD(P)H-hydrate dehydratase [Deltaproteobacteria bacterium]